MSWTAWPAAMPGGIICPRWPTRAWGKSIDALQDARRAVQMDPNNTEYQMHLRQMQNPGQNYRTQTTYTQSGGVTQWCWNLILLNLLCNCCCGGRMFFRPLFCF